MTCAVPCPEPCAALLRARALRLTLQIPTCFLLSIRYDFDTSWTRRISFCFCFLRSRDDSAKFLAVVGADWKTQTVSARGSPRQHLIAHGDSVLWICKACGATMLFDVVGCIFVTVPWSSSLYWLWRTYIMHVTKSSQ